MARRRQHKSCAGVVCARLVVAGCAWACALLAAVAAEAHADVDTSTGLGDNTLTNSGTYLTFYFYSRTLANYGHTYVTYR